MVDLSWADPLIRNYATPVVGAALILSGIFLRLLGKGVAYLILGLGIAGTLYLILRGTGTPSGTWVVPAIFLAGIAVAVSLALAFRALTVALEFGFFTVGYYLVLRAVPSFVSSFPSIASVPGVSAWIGSTIITTAIVEGTMRRFMRTRRATAASSAAVGAAIRGVR